MRVHEVVIVVAMLFAGSSVAGGMARREAPLKVSGVRASSAPAVEAKGVRGRIVETGSTPCARTAEYELRCDPARPRALDRRPAAR